MTITTLPDTSAHQVQLIIGDTPEDFIAETVIQFILDNNSDNVNAASITSLQYIIGDLSKKIDEEVGDIEVEWSQRLKHYRALLESLLKDPAFGFTPALHTFGGVSKEEIDRVRNNSDSKGSPIREGFFTNTRITRRDNSSFNDVEDC